MTERKPISKRVRFEIFKRDGFACQYCGSRPPQAVFEIDHIKPLAEGGTDDMDNLVTACTSCNRGKAAIPLSVVPRSLAEKAIDVAEREEQLQAYQSVLAAKRERLEDEAWRVVLELTGQDQSMNRGWFTQIKFCLERLGLHEVLEAAEIARNKDLRGERQTFAYFRGICNRKINNDDRGGSFIPYVSEGN